MIKKEPVKGTLKDSDFCMLACAAHKLANDNSIEVPEWVFDEKYIMKNPYYAFNTKNKEYQEFLRDTSPEEYTSRNVFYGGNVLQRV